MNCLYITLFFNTVAGIVQTFVKSWNQLMYPRVIEVCRLPFESRRDFFVVLDISGTMWCNSLIVTRRFARISSSISWRRSPEIKDLFVVNISLSFGEFTAPLRHILPIHNVTINSNNLFVNFRWTFTFCFEKSYDGRHLAFGGTLDRRRHFKHVSFKESRSYHCQTGTAHR
jgi:hypothetical protein